MAVLVVAVVSVVEDVIGRVVPIVAEELLLGLDGKSVLLHFISR